MIIIYSVCSSYFTLVLDNRILSNMFYPKTLDCVCAHISLFVAHLLIDLLWFVKAVQPPAFLTAVQKL